MELIMVLLKNGVWQASATIEEIASRDQLRTAALSQVLVLQVRLLELVYQLLNIIGTLQVMAYSVNFGNGYFGTTSVTWRNRTQMVMQ